ncbi:MAG TPA: hypothetical protein PLJ78_11440 [Anaerolineae bacterium]|nr:hypothetical protein [Anaerolineae bacterium]HQK14542.1 hypothetical protein [Anaerolineae bacterium]
MTRYSLLFIPFYILALIGYFGPWVGRRAAALAWNAYDLFDLLRLLPEIETGALSVNLQTLRLPLVGLAVLLPLLLSQANRGWRIMGALLGMGLALATLPPYPEIVTAWYTPGWRVPFWWGIGATLATGAAVWFAPRLGRYRAWLMLAWIAVTGLPAVATLYRLLPALRSLHAAPVQPGWGFWVCMGGLLGLALFLISGRYFQGG